MIRNSYTGACPLCYLPFGECRCSLEALVDHNLYPKRTHREDAEELLDDMAELIIKFLKKAEGKPSKALKIMGREGFVIDNLNDRWQKLVFTLYSELVGLSTEATDILEYFEEE